MARLIKWWFFLAVGFYLTGLLSILPLPADLQWYRPHFMLMFVIYCQIVNPHSFNPVIAWIMGLLLDSLLGTKLGEHALVFAVISYFAAWLRPRFLLRPLWQHGGKIFLLVCLAQIFILWFHALAGQNPHTLLYWAGALISCLVWPIFVAVLSVGRPLIKIPFSSRNLVS